MIRRRYPLASFFLFSALACATLGVDREKPLSSRGSGQSLRARRRRIEKLRQAVSLPARSVIIGYGVNSRGEFGNLDKVAETSQIPEIEKELKGDATDAERYSRLGHLYYRANQPTKSKEASLKAVVLFRKQLEQYPGDVSIQLHLADDLGYAEKYEEAEALVRRVVKDHPNDWHAWLALGKILDGKCWTVILGPKDWRFSDPATLVKLVRAARPAPEKIAASQQHRSEAEGCYDRALRLAPDAAEVYRRRGASRFMYGMLDFGLRAYKGEKLDFFDCFLGREAKWDFVADLRRAVNLDRREYKGIGFVAFIEATRDFRDRQLRDPSAKPPDKMVDVLSQPTRNHILEDVARLEKGIQDPDKYKAAEAAEVLGFLQFLVFADCSAAERSARRSIELDPKREAAWDLLISCPMTTKDFRRFETVSRERLKHKDSARNRLMLAKVYEYLDQLDQAEVVVRVGLQREPDDFMLRLALADLRLMREDDFSLYLAGESLVKLNDEDLSGDRGEDRWSNCTFALGIYYALIGETERAKKWLKQVQKYKPDYPRIEDALKALEE